MGFLDLNGLSLFLDRTKEFFDSTYLRQDDVVSLGEIDDALEEADFRVPPPDLYVYLYNGDTLHFSNEPISNHGENVLTDKYFVDANSRFDYSARAPWESKAYDITTITSNGNVVPPKDISFFFVDMYFLDDISGLSSWNTSQVEYMRETFSTCANLQDISSIGNWETGNVVDMYGLFNQCESLSDISPLESWNTSNVVNMEALFLHCVEIYEIWPLAYWKTGNVRTMNSMFMGCGNVDTFEYLEYWDVSNVEEAYDMFAETTAPLPGWAIDWEREGWSIR